MRHAFDNYPSPFWYSTYLMEQSGIPVQGTILEPCAGDGAIASVLKLYPQIDKIWTNDINRDVNCDFYLDAANPKNWELFPEVDYIITNPPFNAASQILPLAIAKAKKGVFCFLRASFAEPTENRRWLKAHPIAIRHELPRFKFRQDDAGRWATDNGTISLFGWSKAIAPQMVSVFSEDIWDYYDRPTLAPSLKELKMRTSQRCAQLSLF